MQTDTYTQDLAQLAESDMRTAAEILLQNLDRLRDMSLAIDTLRGAEDRHQVIAETYRETATLFVADIMHAAKAFAESFRSGEPNLPAFTAKVEASGNGAEAAFKALSNDTAEINARVANAFEERARAAADAQAALDMANEPKGKLGRSRKKIKTDDAAPNPPEA